MMTSLLALWLAQAPVLNDAPAPAGVPSGVSVDAMRDAMHTYVRGERRSSLPFGVAALSTLTASALCLTTNEPIARGAAWPLLGFGVLELAAGLFFGLRNDQPKLDRLLDDDPDAFAAEEKKKVSRISGTFQPLLLGIEGVIIGTGGVLAGLGALQRNGTLEGVGIGLALQGLAFFLIDWAVLDRADDYLAVLGRFR
jgi:hypothetical protein